ncbi:MAG: hypothetical protein JWN33_350 [Candidatus Saccharibacteria bacterium]|nr:hypothetical protein [Candidatus Saccharibacteria bacterium]
MDASMIFVFAAIVIIGALLLALITFTHRGVKPLAVEKYRSSWMTIERQLKKDDVASLHVCVLSADKLLDQALRERGFKGDTMGERMKAAKNIWTNANQVWNAHKLRNRIAHETDVVVKYDDVRRHLSAYKRALMDVGAI